MDPLSTELQNLRDELRRTRRGLVALVLGLFALAFSAQAESGRKELRADRVLIGTAEKGIVIEADANNGARITLMAEGARVELISKGGAASVSAAAVAENPKHSIAAGLSVGGPVTGLVVTQRSEHASDAGDFVYATSVGPKGIKVTAMPEHGSVKTVGSLP